MGQDFKIFQDISRFFGLLLRKNGFVFELKKENVARILFSIAYGGINKHLTGTRESRFQDSKIFQDISRS